MIGNNACKANLIEKVIFAENLDFPIQSSQEKHKKEIVKANHNKLNINDVQISHPNDIKKMDFWKKIPAKYYSE